LSAFPLHIGTNPPAYWDDIEKRQAAIGEGSAPFLRDQKRPRTADQDLDWNALGFDVRWVGDDPTDCVAALNPGFYHGRGASEYERFVQGAASRGETALVISTIAEAAETAPSGLESLFSDSAGSDLLPTWSSSISARYLGGHASLHLTDTVQGADRDLALRLINDDLRWWVLELHGSQESWSGRGEVARAAQGLLTPLIQTNLGEIVVGVWVAPDGVERRYVLPPNVNWSSVADWVAEQGIPEFVPSALRRFKSFKSVPLELMTADEIATSKALAAFTAAATVERERLEKISAAAQSEADQMRHELLFARASELVDGVAKVFRAAGITVTYLDDELGGTKSADLLCSYAGQTRLVEVKSVGGRASERLYFDLLRHLETWPAMGNAQSISGGALVLNHEHKKHPLERSAMPYTRAEFLASQREPVVTTRDLFDAWRTADYQTVRSLLYPSGAAAPETDVKQSQNSGGSVKQPWWRTQGLKGSGSNPQSLWSRWRASRSGRTP